MSEKFARTFRRTGATARILHNPRWGANVLHPRRRNADQFIGVNYVADQLLLCTIVTNAIIRKYHRFDHWNRRNHRPADGGARGVFPIFWNRNLSGSSGDFDRKLHHNRWAGDADAAKHDRSHRRRWAIADRHPVQLVAQSDHHRDIDRCHRDSSGNCSKRHLCRWPLQSILGTWESGINAGVYQLDFNPNAEFAIVGSADGETAVLAGLYTGNGSINGNTGHNPFTAKSATFTLSSPEITAGTTITGVSFIYNTALSYVVPGTPTTPPPPPAVPEPSSVGFGLAILGVCGAARRRKGNAPVA